MQAVIPGQANSVKADMVKRSDGSPITTGTVTFYVIALTGSNAGKWFKTADDTWADTEQPAGTVTAEEGHKADGHWLCPIDAAAWAYGVLYLMYAKESGDLHIPYSEQVVPSLSVGAIGTGETSWTYTLTETGTGDPIADAEIWVTTDLAGNNIVYDGQTDVNGQVTFYLTPGTYYVWRRKAGYTFTNPDTEVVS